MKTFTFCWDLGFYLQVRYIHELVCYVYCAKLGNLHPSCRLIDWLQILMIDCHNMHSLVPTDLNEIGMVLAKDWKNHTIYEARLFVCFVLFVLMRSTESGCFRVHSWSLFWKALDAKGCMGLVPWQRLDLPCKSSWILNDFFHWKLN
jgi:hypothetical protein